MRCLASGDSTFVLRRFCNKPAQNFLREQSPAILDARSRCAARGEPRESASMTMVGSIRNGTRQGIPDWKPSPLRLTAGGLIQLFEQRRSAFSSAPNPLQSPRLQFGERAS